VQHVQVAVQRVACGASQNRGEKVNAAENMRRQRVCVFSVYAAGNFARRMPQQRTEPARKRARSGSRCSIWRNAVVRRQRGNNPHRQPRQNQQQDGSERKYAAGDGGNTTAGERGRYAQTQPQPNAKGQKSPRQRKGVAWQRE